MSATTIPLCVTDNKKKKFSIISLGRLILCKRLISHVKVSLDVLCGVLYYKLGFNNFIFNSRNRNYIYVY